MQPPLSPKTVTVAPSVCLFAKRRLSMGRWLAFTIAALMLTHVAFADTSVQTSWFLGPGINGPVTDWGESFWESESIAYSVKGQISLLAERSDPNAWTKIIIDTDYFIDGHANILPADIDGDDRFELVTIISGNPGKVVYYEYTGSGFVRYDVADFVNLPLGTTWPYDLDGDGDIDIVASANEGLVWYINDGGGTFTRKDIDLSMGYLYARPGDVDNDNDVDIVVHDLTQDGYMHGDLWLFRNDGLMSFSAEKIFTVPNPSISEIWRVNVGDLDGDGYLDIQTSGHPLRVFLNDGTGTFWLKFTLNDTIHVDGSWLSDFDRDGDLDIMGAHWGYASYYPKPLFWFENDGSGMSFDYHIIGGEGGDYGDGGMAIDVNLDGLMDALGAYWSVAWFEQLSGGGFVEHILPDVNINNSHWIYGENLEGGTCTGDVDIDIFVADYETLLFWENHMVTFYKEGYLTSSILDAEGNAEWTTFSWDHCVPRGCINEYLVRSGETVPEIEVSPWLGPILSSGDSLKDYAVPDGRYFQYMVTLRNLTAPDDISPSVEEVWVTYEVEKCEPVEPWYPRTQGYWRRQCKDKPHEDICAHVDSVHALADLFDAFDCDSICALMKVDPPEKDMCRKARRQFMALLLNVASGKLAVCNCLEDGREVGDVIAEIDSLLSNFSDHATCEHAKTLADDINNGKGIVPCDSIFHVPSPPNSAMIPHSAAPNPFAESTRMRYELAARAHVRLKIFDKMGRLLRVMTDEVMGPGVHSTEWDGLDDKGNAMPSGIYIYSIQTETSNSAGKLILIR